MVVSMTCSKMRLEDRSGCCIYLEYSDGFNIFRVRDSVVVGRVLPGCKPLSVARVTNPSEPNREMVNVYTLFQHDNYLQPRA